LVSVVGARDEIGARAFAEWLSVAAGGALVVHGGEVPDGTVVSVGVTIPTRYHPLLTVAITDGLPWVLWREDVRTLRGALDVELSDARRPVAEAIGRWLAGRAHRS
jgi:hypothetical protein